MFPYKTLIFMTHGYIKKKYKNAFLKKGLLKIALCTLKSSISAPRQKFSKKKTRMLRFIVPDVPLQNTFFNDTLLCQKKCIKVCWAKLPPFSVFCHLFCCFSLFLTVFCCWPCPSLIISSSKHQIKKLTKHKRSTINLTFQKSKNMPNNLIID